MSTYNIGFYKKMSKIIHELSSNLRTLSVLLNVPTSASSPKNLYLYPHSMNNTASGYFSLISINCCSSCVYFNLGFFRVVGVGDFSRNRNNLTNEPRDEKASLNFQTYPTVKFLKF